MIEKWTDRQTKRYLKSHSSDSSHVYLTEDSSLESHFDVHTFGKKTGRISVIFNELKGAFVPFVALTCISLSIKYLPIFRLFFFLLHLKHYIT